MSGKRFAVVAVRQEFPSGQTLLGVLAIGESEAQAAQVAHELQSLVKSWPLSGGPIYFQVLPAADKGPAARAELLKSLLG